MKTLYHYTCDHSRKLLGDSGELVPARDLSTAPPWVRQTMPWQGTVVWLTDLDRPDRYGLGLTSELITCDRTVHRYRVTCNLGITGWLWARNSAPAAIAEELESLAGSMPSHWYVAPGPVPVVYDPVPEVVNA